MFYSWRNRKINTTFFEQVKKKFHYKTENFLQAFGKLQESFPSISLIECIFRFQLEISLEIEESTNFPRGFNFPTEFIDCYWQKIFLLNPHSSADFFLIVFRKVLNQLKASKFYKT